MKIDITLKRIIFGLSTLFVLTSIFAITIGQLLPMEFIDLDMRNGYYKSLLVLLPIIILASLLFSINNGNSKGRNLTIRILTFIVAGLVFCRLVILVFTNAFGVWTSEEVLFKSLQDSRITIKEQIYDQGALGTGGHRIVQFTPFLFIFQKVAPIDTATFDQTSWIKIN